VSGKIKESAMHTTPRAENIDARLLEQINACAMRQGLTAETWLRRQVQVHTPAQPPSAADEEETILDMVQRHFYELRLDRDAQRSVARAMFDTIEFGHPHDIGQLGPMGRCYQFRRRSGALSIRVGQGKVELSLPFALRLATALDTGGRHREPETEAA
jgi:hypothetical protein